jgi:phage terminase large subunit GpA-like protein
MTIRALYQKEIMDAVGHPSVDRIVMMTAAQVGKTELLLNVIGFHIDQEPAAILLVEPTLEMGEAVSKDRIAPMIRDTPALQGKIKDPRSRDSGNTLLHKTFPGGHITIAGANSAASLASRPIRVLLCDEVDRYPASAGTEGDPVNLAIQRTSNFWNRRIMLVSTPTIMGISRIEKAYETGTKERWCVPCPVCGEFQPYDWGQIVYKELTEPLMKCRKCGALCTEKHWKNGQSRGIWIPDKTGEVRTRSFHLNAFASPWTTWKSLVEQYEEAYRNGEEELKVWWNTKLGLPWESRSGAIEVDILESRREAYAAPVPDGVLVLTCGVDTQDDRLEAEVVGWGVGKESWGIEYRVFYGDPGQKEVWLALDDFLSHFWSYADGEEIGISCACIDSAGHYTDDVYRFCKPRARRNIFAIVGRGDSGKPSVSKPSRNNRRHVPLFTLGVSTIKGSLYSRLRIDRPGPGYCHFPIEPKTNHRGYDSPYFKGLVSERMVVKRVRGKERIEWETRSAGIRNEPLDVRVYATGALEILNPDLERRKERRIVKGRSKKQPVTKTQTPVQPRESLGKAEIPPEPRSAKQTEKRTASPKRGFRIVGRGMQI